MPAYVEAAEAWTEVAARLRAALPAATYRAWLDPLQPSTISADELVIVAPRGLQRWVADRFGPLLERCACSALGREISVRVEADDEGGHAGAAQPPAVDAATLNPKYTFEQFVIGAGNRLAHAAALAVAELPGQAYNPLFIYGPPGLGKTHLMHSIAGYVATNDPSLTVRCTSVEAFTNGFVNALQTGATEKFKARYRGNDVLLVDDVQFLCSKVRTEEEFFHTFNALYECGSQLVFTCDRLPRDLDGLEDRLRERFESGLVTDIQPPDFETRLAILRKRARHDGIALEGAGVLEHIAERIDDNIRALEGALIRVVAYHSLTDRPIDARLAREVLDRLAPAAGPLRHTNVRDIQEQTCQRFAISRDELLSATRTARIAWPRQVAMYLSRELTNDTLPAIARQFGGRSHTTVLHAHQRTRERMRQDPDAQSTVSDLLTRLTDVNGDRGD